MGRTAGALNKPKLIEVSIETKNINQEEQPKMTEVFTEVENTEGTSEKMYVRDGKRFTEKERQTFVELVTSLKKLTSPSDLKDKFNKVADLFMDEVMDVETALLVVRNALEQHSKSNVDELKAMKAELLKEK